MKYSGVVELDQSDTSAREGVTRQQCWKCHEVGVNLLGNTRNLG